MVGSFAVLWGALPERMFRTVLGQHWPAVFLSIQILGIRAHEEMPPPLETDLKERFPCNGFKKKECVFFQQLSASTPRPAAVRPLLSVARGPHLSAGGGRVLVGWPSSPPHPSSPRENHFVPFLHGPLWPALPIIPQNLSRKVTSGPCVQSLNKIGINGKRNCRALRT